MVLSFEELDAESGLAIYDSVEQRHLTVQSSHPLTPSPADTDAFVFPVDQACSVTATSLTFNDLCFASLHDETGKCLSTLDPGESLSFEEKVQFIGLDGPAQIYCHLTSGGQVETGLSATQLSFDHPSTVRIGARSHHEQPAGTIHTPAEPQAMMEAISLLSSALKTTSPERAWPSLRGHPPLLKVADEFDKPSGLATPETDITITVPPTYRDIFTVAPLAFYSGATLQPGSEVILRAPDLESVLGANTRLEDEIATLLKQFFFLDCVVRTEGLFQTGLYERQCVEDDLPFDLADTYDTPIAERLRRYLTVSYEDISPYVPNWPLTAHVKPKPQTIEIVPHIVNELGIIRETRGEFGAEPSRNRTGQTPHLRSPSLSRHPVDPAGRDEQTFVVPDITNESLEHAWFGDSFPQGASKATVEAFQSQLAQENRSESIDILLVCNDARMLDEHSLLDEVYGNRELLPFTITSEFGVTAARLESLLTDHQHDFFHFIGHATPEGLHCTNEVLDIRSLEAVNVGVFFLNACQSYEQGLALAQRGAFGGVSTVKEVINEHAVEAGETLARLLNRGFPLRASLAIARKNTGLGDEYLIVGDGSTDIAQSGGGAPAIAEVESRSGSEFEFMVHSYSTKDFKLGTTTESTLQTTQDTHLTPNSTPTSIVTKASLKEYLTWTEVPVLIDGEIFWNDGIGTVSLP